MTNWQIFPCNAVTEALASTDQLASAVQLVFTGCQQKSRVDENLVV